MKPVCVKCERFYRPKRNGYYFIEGMPVGSERALPGLAQPHLWQPYKTWAGDLWECPDCHAEIIVGVPFTPITENHKPDFAKITASLGASQLLVKDC